MKMYISAKIDNCRCGNQRASAPIPIIAIAIGLQIKCVRNFVPCQMAIDTATVRPHIVWRDHELTIQQIHIQTR